ncbi:hypothetical protein ColTof4_13587 [Colletotrichum tofieldiae]|nr:hypothetical protein ColTof3_14536 [Colletotrichum tofieldiae]GKT81164.1 hypothetical protein ColTof4_13587 [Colletotrichum tofieldiae]GKT97324.1 hypothetical protein Ct61P_15174 [Colletotrichum tofieldiae]
MQSASPPSTTPTSKSLMRTPPIPKPAVTKLSDFDQAKAVILSHLPNPLRFFQRKARDATAITSLLSLITQGHHRGVLPLFATQISMHLPAAAPSPALMFLADQKRSCP